jgi:hypothetical protein
MAKIMARVMSCVFSTTGDDRAGTDSGSHAYHLSGYRSEPVGGFADGGLAHRLGFLEQGGGTEWTIAAHQTNPVVLNRNAQL